MFAKNLKSSTKFLPAHRGPKISVSSVVTMCHQIILSSPWTHFDTCRTRSAPVQPADLCTMPVCHQSTVL